MGGRRLSVSRESEVVESGVFLSGVEREAPAESIPLEDRETCRGGEPEPFAIGDHEGVEADEAAPVSRQVGGFEAQAEALVRILRSDRVLHLFVEAGETFAGEVFADADGRPVAGKIAVPGFPSIREAAGADLNLDFLAIGFVENGCEGQKNFVGHFGASGRFEVKVGREAEFFLVVAVDRPEAEVPLPHAIGFVDDRDA